MQTMQDSGMEEKIIGAATRIFARDGYETAGMGDIAGEAGINRTALHYYFRTKDRLYEEVFSRLIGSLIPRIEAVLSREEEFFEKVDGIIDEYMAVYRANPFLPGLIIREVRRNPDRLVAVMKNLRYGEFLSSLRTVLEAEMERGTVRRMPIPVAATVFFSQLSFPFLTRNLIERMFPDEVAGFEEFLGLWKGSVKTNIRAILSAGGNR